MPRIRPYVPYLVIIALMAVTCLALVFGVDVTVSPEAGVQLRLPDAAGDWKGAEIRFCQNPDCLKEYVGRGDLTRCPACGGQLDTRALAENQLMPADTVVVRKQYVRRPNEVVVATLVLSGRERASIHRPQICLVGQGYRIVKSTVLSAPLPGRDPLRVMTLDAEYAFRLPDGRTSRHLSCFAYWFVGKGRETPYQWQRIVWMATDRIFRNVAHRWAYVSISTGRKENSEEHLRLLTEFVQALYPTILKDSGRD